MPSKIADVQIKVSNYLVPATGGTAAVSVKYAGDGTEEIPVVAEWKNFSLDGEPFNPSGFYAANFSVNSVYLKISGNDLVYEIPPGAQMGRMYPAPFDHNVRIYGAGTAELVFVNSPVIPYGLDGGGGGGGGGSVTLADSADFTQGSVLSAPAVSPDANSTVVALLKALLGVQNGLDSGGEFLPIYFESLPQSFTYTAGVLQTEVRTAGGTTWTRTYTYTGSDLTGVSQWVRFSA